MRFRVDMRSSRLRYGDHINAARFDILVDGQRRGLIAFRDGDGNWGADIIGVPLVQGLWGHDRLEHWLRENVDADVLAPRPAASQK